MDSHPRSPWWYVAGTVVLLGEWLQHLHQAHASRVAGWGYLVGAGCLALAALAAWRRERNAAISTAPPNER